MPSPRRIAPIASTAGGRASAAPPCRRLMEAELKALEAALGSPARPVVAIVGGAKVSTKLDLLGNLSKKVDVLVIGGAMANTFLAAQGHAMGRSLQEAEMHDTARAILAEAGAGRCEILLPLDLVVAEVFEANAPSRSVSWNGVPPEAMALDVGPRTGGGHRGAAAPGLDAGVERAARRLSRSRPSTRRRWRWPRRWAGLTHLRRPEVDRRRGGYGGGARPCRGGGADDLCLDRRRGVPGMAGGKELPGVAGAGGGCRQPEGPARGSSEPGAEFPLRPGLPDRRPGGFRSLGPVWSAWGGGRHVPGIGAGPPRDPAAGEGFSSNSAEFASLGCWNANAPARKLRPCGSCLFVWCGRSARLSHSSRPRLDNAAQ